MLHGIFLTINHGWRVFATHRWRDRSSYDRIMKPSGWALTFVSVTTAMVFFRGSTVKSAIDLVKGVIGLNGFSLPHGVGAIAQTYGTDIEKAAMWGPRFCSSRSSVPIRFKSSRRMNQRWA